MPCRRRGGAPDFRNDSDNRKARGRRAVIIFVASRLMRSFESLGTTPPPLRVFAPAEMFAAIIDCSAVRGLNGTLVPWQVHYPGEFRIIHGQSRPPDCGQIGGVWQFCPRRFVVNLLTIAGAPPRPTAHVRRTPPPITQVMALSRSFQISLCSSSALSAPGVIPTPA